jgi:hypothetical protein
MLSGITVIPREPAPTPMVAISLSEAVTISDYIPLPRVPMNAVAPPGLTRPT